MAFHSVVLPFHYELTRVRTIIRRPDLRSTLMVLSLLGILSRSPAVAQTRAATGPTATGSSASFRGLSIAADGTIWVSGSGTVLRSTDGGVTWEPRSSAETKSFSLRDVEAVSATTAYVLVTQEGMGRIYKTTDGGQSWVRQYDDTRKGIFLDGFAFWDASRGVVVGDPIDGRFVILRTDDGGATWSQVPAQDAPQAQPGEAVFAASGSSITVGANGRVWIGTGSNSGTKVGRVLRSADYGRTWEVADTPIPSSSSNGGIFSLAFQDTLHGVAVGGDFDRPDADRPKIAVTTDGGKTWRLDEATGATGYFEAVAYVPAAGPKALVAVGSMGVFASLDAGRSWRQLNADSYHAVAAGKSIIASGENGRVGLWPSLNGARDASPSPQQRKPAKGE